MTLREHPSPATRVCWELAQQTRPDDVLIVGVGTPLAAAAALLARELLYPSLTILFGTAVTPRNFDLATSIVDASHISRAALGNYSQVEVLDLVARGKVTLQFVSPIEVDRHGNLNASRVRREDGSWRQFPGSLAIGDTSVLVGRLIAYRVGHNKRFLPERVSFVSGAGAIDHDSPHTSRGQGAVAVITDSATVSLGERPTLINYSGDLDVALDGISFAVQKSRAVVRQNIPNEALDALQIVDPLCVRDLEDKDRRSDVLTRITSRIKSVTRDDQ